GALDERAWAGVLDGRTPKEIELVRIQDEPYYVVRYTAVDDVAAQTSRRERLHQPYVVGGRSEPGQLLVAADGLTARTDPFTTSSIRRRIESALTQDINVVDHALLTEYDSYYYSRGGEAPLPVLRVRLDDPLETWIYVDPQMSRVLGQVHRLARLERWLFNGLHSLDFAFWYDKRPLWDIGMIILSLGGLIASAIGLVFGFRRLSRIR